MILVALHQFAQQRHLGEVGAKLIVDVARDARPFLFERFLLSQAGQLALEFLGGNVIDRARHQAKHPDAGDAEEPERLPEVRLHHERHRRAPLVPNAILVAGRDLETIFTRRQPAVTGDAQVADFGPRGFVAFQPVFETRPIRRGEIEAGVVDFQPLFLWRHDDALRRPGAKSALAPHHPVRQHRLDRDGRRIGVEFNLRRIDGNQSFDGGKPEPAIAGPAGSWLRTLGTFARGQAIGLVERPDWD